MIQVCFFLLFYLLVLHLQLHQLLCLIIQPTLELRQSVDLQLLLQQPQFAEIPLQANTTLTLLITPVHTAGDDGIRLHVVYVRMSCCVEGVWIHLNLRLKMVSSALSSCSFT